MEIVPGALERMKQTKRVSAFYAAETTPPALPASAPAPEEPVTSMRRRKMSCRTIIVPEARERRSILDRSTLAAIAFGLLVVFSVAAIIVGH